MHNMAHQQAVIATSSPPLQLPACGPGTCLSCVYRKAWAFLIFIYLLAGAPLRPDSSPSICQKIARTRHCHQPCSFCPAWVWHCALAGERCSDSVTASSNLHLPSLCGAASLLLLTDDHIVKIHTALLSC